jgi:hypothetical protein
MKHPTFQYTSMPSLNTLYIFILAYSVRRFFFGGGGVKSLLQVDIKFWYAALSGLSSQCICYCVLLSSNVFIKFLKYLGVSSRCTALSRLRILYIRVM